MWGMGGNRLTTNRAKAIADNVSDRDVGHLSRTDTSAPLHIKNGSRNIKIRPIATKLENKTHNTMTKDPAA